MWLLSSLKTIPLVLKCSPSNSVLNWFRQRRAKAEDERTQSITLRCTNRYFKWPLAVGTCFQEIGIRASLHTIDDGIGCGAAAAGMREGQPVPLEETGGPHAEDLAAQVGCFSSQILDTFCVLRCLPQAKGRTATGKFRFAV